jgi:hypothetical protein
LLDPIPELGLHLDIGHANLLVELNSTDELLAAFGKRLRHVHLHDNKGGGSDLHLPLGAGSLETAHYIRSLQAVGYNDTITLEVFSPDRHHLSYSVEVLRQLWKDCATTPVAKMPGLLCKRAAIHPSSLGLDFSTHRFHASGALVGFNHLGKQGFTVLLKIFDSLK